MGILRNNSRLDTSLSPLFWDDAIHSQEISEKFNDEVYFFIEKALAIKYLLDVNNI